MPGWMEKISDIKKYEQLPQNTKLYIKKLEELIETPITAISVGPNRDQTIIIKNPFEK